MLNYITSTEERERVNIWKYFLVRRRVFSNCKSIYNLVMCFCFLDKWFKFQMCSPWLQVSLGVICIIARIILQRIILDHSHRMKEENIFKCRDYYQYFCLLTQIFCTTVKAAQKFLQSVALHYLLCLCHTWVRVYSLVEKTAHVLLSLPLAKNQSQNPLTCYHYAPITLSLDILWFM